MSPDNITSGVSQYSKEYNRLVRNLPPAVVQQLETYKLDYKAYGYLDQLKHPNLFPALFENKSLEKIARIALCAFRNYALSYPETISTFMHLAAHAEFIQNPKTTIYYEEDGETKFYIRLLNFEENHVPTISCHFNSTYQSLNVGTSRTNYPHYKIPLLKSYFNFSKKDWIKFSKMIGSVSPRERYFSLFPLAQRATWPPIYKKICSLIRCFHPVEIETNENLYSAFIVPSFSMLTLFFEIEAAKKKRPSALLTPVFGELSINEVGRMKAKKQSPFGLYCPVPKQLDIDCEITRHYMKTVDGYSGCDAASFWIHDVYHLVREYEMTAEISAARFHIVDLLEKYQISYSQSSKKYELIQNLKKYLIDGELLFCYDKSLFYNPRAYEMPFGILFKLQRSLWDFDLIKLVIRSMVKEKRIWKHKFHLGFDDLIKRSHQKYYMEVDFMYRVFYKGKIAAHHGREFHYTFPEMGNVNQSCFQSSEKVLRLFLSSIKILLCESLEFYLGAAQQILASGSVLIDNSYVTFVESAETVFTINSCIERIRAKRVIINFVKKEEWIHDIEAEEIRLFAHPNCVAAKNINCKKLFLHEPVDVINFEDYSHIDEVFFCSNNNVVVVHLDSTSHIGSYQPCSGYNIEASLDV